MSRPGYTPLFSSIREDRRLASLDDRAALFYLLLLAQVDAHGRIGADLDLLNADVWPLFKRTADDVRGALERCAVAGLLELHECDGQSWVQYVGWDELQGSVGRKRERPKSGFPSPSPETQALPSIAGGSGSATTTREPTDTHPARQRGGMRCDLVSVSEAASGSEAESEAAPAPSAPAAPAPKQSQSKRPGSWEEVLARPEFAPARESAAFMAAWKEWIEACAEPAKNGKRRTVPAGVQATKMLRQACGLTPQLQELNQSPAWHLGRYIRAIDQSIVGGWQSVNLDYLPAAAPAPAAPKPATRVPQTEFERACPGASERDARAGVQDAWEAMRRRDLGGKELERHVRKLQRLGRFFLDLKPDDLAWPDGCEPPSVVVDAEVAP